jgi:hypothetical protein
MIDETKKRFKQYKIGKNWVTSAIAGGALIMLSTVSVSADETTDPTVNSTPTPVQQSNVVLNGVNSTTTSSYALAYSSQIAAASSVALSQSANSTAHSDGNIAISSAIASGNAAITSTTSALTSTANTVSSVSSLASTLNDSASAINSVVSTDNSNASLINQSVSSVNSAINSANSIAHSVGLSTTISSVSNAPSVNSISGSTQITITSSSGNTVIPSYVAVDNTNPTTISSTIAQNNNIYSSTVSSVNSVMTSEMNSISNAVSSYSNAISSYAIAESSYSNAISSYSIAESSYSNALTSYNVAISSYNSNIYSWNEGGAVLKAGDNTFVQGGVNATAAQLSGINKTIQTNTNILNANYRVDKIMKIGESVVIKNVVNKDGSVQDLTFTLTGAQNGNNIAENAVTFFWSKDTGLGFMLSAPYYGSGSGGIGGEDSAGSVGGTSFGNAMTYVYDFDFTITGQGSDDIQYLYINIEEAQNIINQNFVYGAELITNLSEQFRKNYAAMNLNMPSVKDIIPEHGQQTQSKESESLRQKVRKLFAQIQYKFFLQLTDDDVRDVEYAIGPSLSQGELEGLPKLQRQEVFLNMTGYKNISFRIPDLTEEKAKLYGGD